MNEQKLKINCTSSKEALCGNCSIKGKIACKFNSKTLKHFMAIGFPPAVAAIAGLILSGIFTGQWWMLIAYCVFTFGMIGVIEMFFLCRHCPYYALEGKTIVCIGNYGSLKLLPYSPYPMNKFERLSMRAFVAFAFFILPISGMAGTLFLLRNEIGYHLMTLLLVMTFLILFFSIRFVKILLRDFCTQCVNFSCPFNLVAKKTVDDYLKMNPVMKKAWGKKGYKVG